MSTNVSNALSVKPKICVSWLKTRRCLKKQLPSDVKMVLVYISGYAVRHEGDDDDTGGIYLQHGSYLNSLNRGGLKIPGDCVCQWVLFATLFSTI